VKKTDKLKQGQLIITDKAGKVLCQRALKEAELKKDAEGKFAWDGKRADASSITRADAPYRVQIQAHSEPKEEKGVAIAAMHTEVRLFVHPDTNKTKLTPWDDPNSLVLGLAPVWPKPLVVTDGDKFVAKRLDDAGYYPGPVAERSPTWRRALSRSSSGRIPSRPAPALRGSIRRTGTPNADAKNVLDAAATRQHAPDLRQG